MSYEEFLGKDETAGKPETFQHDNVDFDMIPVAGPGLGPDDRVLMTVRSATEPCVLITGEPFNDRILDGLGRLIAVDLAEGVRHERRLVVGEKSSIPVGSLYWYENDGPGAHLVVQSTSPGFKPEYEPPLRDIVGLLKPLHPFIVWTE